MFRYYLLEQAGSMFYLLLFIIVFTIPAYAESIDDLEQAIAQNPDDLDARKELALSYYEQGDLNRAVIQLESLVQLDPGAIDVARDLTAAYRMVSLKLQAQRSIPKRCDTRINPSPSTENMNWTQYPGNTSAS